MSFNPGLEAEQLAKMVELRYLLFTPGLSPPEERFEDAFVFSE